VGRAGCINILEGTLTCPLACRPRSVLFRCTRGELIRQRRTALYQFYAARNIAATRGLQLIAVDRVTFFPVIAHSTCRRAVCLSSRIPQTISGRFPATRGGNARSRSLASKNALRYKRDQLESFLRRASYREDERPLKIKERS